MDFMNPTDEEDIDRIIDERGDRPISLQGEGGNPVIVASRIAFQSVLVKDALRESDQDHMELSRVPGPVLRKVVEFMEHHVTVEPMHEIADALLATQTFDQVRVWYCRTSPTADRRIHNLFNLSLTLCVFTNRRFTSSGTAILSLAWTKISCWMCSTARTT
jgi:hypothetical protein